MCYIKLIYSIFLSLVFSFLFFNEEGRGAHHHKSRHARMNAEAEAEGLPLPVQLHPFRRVRPLPEAAEAHHGAELRAER